MTFRQRIDVFLVEPEKLQKREPEGVVRRVLPGVCQTLHEHTVSFANDARDCLEHPVQRGRQQVVVQRIVNSLVNIAALLIRDRIGADSIVQLSPARGGDRSDESRIEL